MTPPEDAGRRERLLAAFRMPFVQTMVSRKSSITNAFVNALIPVVIPTPEEIDEALRILNMGPDTVCCAYCGNAMTEWDHLRPLVLRQRPTGYISEIANLVPSCGKCNQSKGNSGWRKWILSTTAKHSPTRRQVPDVAERIERLDAYERWRTPIRIDFESVLGKEVWDEYWRFWETVNADLRRIQDVANTHRGRIEQSLRRE